MDKFIVGRKYGNGQSFYTVAGREKGAFGDKVILWHNDSFKQEESCYVIIKDDMEICQPKYKKTPLKASSLMGKASHKKLLTEEEKEERRKKARKRWNEQNYDNLNIFLPHGMMKKIAEATKEQGYKSQRQFIIHALESAMKISS